MQDAKNLSEYKKELQEALDNEFLRQAMDKFAVAYPAGRARAFTGYDIEALVADAVKAKDAAIGRMDELYAQFKLKAEAAGAKVHLASSAAEANEIIARIAAENKVKKIVKSKSMTAEETLLNHHLEAQGLEVTETDLGEWIIQLRHEGPTHMVMPAIHLSRYQVADLFTEVTKLKQEGDIEKLVKVARRELRQKYVEADMGISGANFAVAETGVMVMLTNEGNGRLVTTLPRVHVALIGLDKLTPTMKDALTVIKVLPRNATGQNLTSYVSIIGGQNECAASPDGKKAMHFVFLDNGRRAMAKDPDYAQVLRCVRCGACANVCPVYRMVGGHKYGHIYIGAIGLILTYFFHGRDKAKYLVQNCINCGACKAVCAAGIDLPRLIKDIHARIQDEDGHPLPSALMAKAMKNRKFFHGLLRAARFAQRPLTGGTPFLRHMPHIFMKGQDFRALPAVADKPYRDLWPAQKNEAKPRGAKYKVALFAGCAVDFLYPEQMTAAVKVLAKAGAGMDFPMEQSCCGLPLEMMGEQAAAREVALQNLQAMDPANYDYIVTLCASCASHLKHAYPRILGDTPGFSIKVKQFADKVIDFSSLARDVLGVDAAFFTQDGKKTTYHAPCHLCRGLGVTKAPRELIAEGGMEYVPCAEEEVCCGFGGTYSVKFPEVSQELLKNKLGNAKATGAEMLVTDCPGCVMQIKGGAEKSAAGLVVKHIAEALAERLK